MGDIFTLENKIKQMIDDLKGLCATNGLSNQAAEEVVITTVFLYKFLNDKFMTNMKAFADEMGMSYQDLLNDEDMMDAFYDSYPQDVAFTYADTIESLINQTTDDRFYKIFDDALQAISDNPKNKDFNIETAGGGKKALFSRVTENVEESKRNNFARNIFGIISSERFNFGDAGKDGFDFYATIFEYLIKDYNVAAGTYAEYYTPQTVCHIIGKILANMSPIEDKIYEIHDPAAGSGSLILHLAHELGQGSFGEKAQVYTQDISNKSSRFLRINLLLNGLKRSLDNIIEGDSLDTPAHYVVPHDPSSGVKQYDFVTVNPPFKYDFSATRDSIEQKWEDSDLHDGYRRFFAGIPKIPANKKDSMAIYLPFIQHVLWSLKSTGKAAIVVPTGFITAKSGIEMAIRKAMVDNHWLKGVVSMPSQIFANTGTNVSVIFIDKSNAEDKVILIDASKLGTKVKDGKNQKTILRPDEVERIINTYTGRAVEEDFSVLVTDEDIREKSYSFSAGQYFEVKIEHVDISADEFRSRMDGYKNSLSNLFAKGCELQTSIMQQFEELNYV